VFLFLPVHPQARSSQRCVTSELGANPAAGLGWCDQQIQPCHWRNPTPLVALRGDLLGHFLLGGAQQGMSGDVDLALPRNAAGLSIKIAVDRRVITV
jgi:hypothetical protein